MWDSVDAHQAAVRSIPPEAFAETMQLLGAPPTGRYYRSASSGAVPADRPVLNQLNIVARDFDAAIEFYRRFGVAVPDAFASPYGGALRL